MKEGRKEGIRKGWEDGRMDGWKEERKMCFQLLYKAYSPQLSTEMAKNILAV